MARFSLWLQPSKSDQEVLKKVILKLVKENRTPFFEPHLTLMSGDLDPRDFLPRIFNNFPPISVKIRVLTQSQRFFQAIFFEMAENRILKELRRQCLQELKMTGTNVRPSHVSLLYGKFVKNERQAIMKTINLKLFTKIEFDKLSLVITEGAVEEWKKIKTIRLRKN